MFRGGDNSTPPFYTNCMPITCKEKLKKRYKRQYRELREKVLKKLGGKCIKCLIDDKDVLQVDHIEPLRQPKRIGNKLRFYGILNGSYSTDNLQLLCANCHMKKTVKQLNEGR